MTYGDYLQLDTLLAAKKPLSDKHDEHLFITIHHVQELWLNLMGHELDAAVDFILRDQLPPSFKSMARMTRILEQMISAWNVLSTMTPSDYLEFRNDLGQSSGFQSFQYRMVEFRLGAKDPKMLLPHRHDAQSLRSAEGRTRCAEPVRRCADAAVPARLRDSRRDREARFFGPACLQRRGAGRLAEGLSRIRRSISTCTNWPRSWSILKIGSSSGVSAT